MSNTKRIHVPYSGPILAKGGAYGPITTPYHETITVIGAMLTGGVPVIEVLPNGEEVSLTIQNFNKVLEVGPVDVVAESTVPTIDPAEEARLKDEAEFAALQAEEEAALKAKQDSEKQAATQKLVDQQKDQARKQQNNEKKIVVSDDATTK